MATATIPAVPEKSAVTLWKKFVCDRLGFEFVGFRSTDGERQTGVVLRAFGMPFTIPAEVLFSEDGREAAQQAAYHAIMERWSDECQGAFIETIGAHIYVDYQNGSITWDVLNASLDAIEALN